MATSLSVPPSARAGESDRQNCNLSGVLLLIQNDFAEERGPRTVRTEWEIKRVGKNNISVSPLHDGEPIEFEFIRNNKPDTDDPYVGPAYQYELKITKNGKKDHVIRLTIAAAKDVDREESLNKLLQALAVLPERRIESIDEIRVNRFANENDLYWRKRYKNFSGVSGASVRRLSPGTAAIDFYPAGMRQINLFKTLRHEFGHTLAIKQWGKTEPFRAWKKAAEADGVSVSEYAENSMAEDFAETIEHYLRHDGWSRNPELRARYANRYALIKEVFYSDPQSWGTAHRLWVRYRRELDLAGIGALAGTGAAVGGYVAYTQFESKKVKQRH